MFCVLDILGGYRVAKPGIEERLARLEGAYEQIDRRLESIERGIADLREEIRDLKRILIYMAIGFITASAGLIATILLIILRP